MTSRIKDHGNGLVEEVIAPAVLLRWDENTNTGQAEFRTVGTVTLNGERLAAKGTPTITIDIDPLNPRTFDVPTGELDELGEPVVVQLDTNLIMATFKAAFDEVYNELYPEELPNG